MNKKIKYIELFSGIGAFTQAIKNLDYVESECVFAADINAKCAQVYNENYHIDSLCDLTKKDEKEIPEHDLCFFSPPCQAFSKSGKRMGFDDARGTLINEVFRILKYRKPKYILMENVRNLVSHDNGNTIRVIYEHLHALGYRLPETPYILSPHYFKTPQTRERAFLPGIYDPENVNKTIEFKFNIKYKKDECKIDGIIEHSYDEVKDLKISSHENKILNIWDEFYNNINKKVIGFPIWMEYFKDKDLEEDMPEWKKDFINKNKLLYKENKKFIDKWLKKYNNLENFTPTERKFEWQAGTKISSIWDGIIQFRPSGIRVKAPTTLPALVALVQIPIIGPLKRRLSVKECLKLQNFEPDFIFNESDHEAYKQLGNSINVKVLQEVLDRLLKYEY